MAKESCPTTPCYTPASGASRECGSDGYRFDNGGWPEDLLVILGKLAP